MRAETATRAEPAAERGSMLEREGVLGPLFLLPAVVYIVALVGFPLVLAVLYAFSDVTVANPRVNKGKLPVGLVGNRLKPWTGNSQQAIDQLKAWPYPVVAQLRDTQAYVLMASLGKSVFDYHSEQIRSHQDDWQPLLRWLRKAL